MPLGNWEGQRRDERSQETCLCGNLKPAAHRLIFLRVYPRRDHVRGAVLLVGSVRAAVDPQPLLYFFQNDF